MSRPGPGDLVLTWPLLLPGYVATGGYVPSLNLTFPCQVELIKGLKGLSQGHRWALCESALSAMDTGEGYYHFSL